MENNLENFLKNKLSVDDLNLETPDISLVNQARQNIKLRKKQVEEKENSKIRNMAERWKRS